MRHTAKWLAMRLRACAYRCGYISWSWRTPAELRDNSCMNVDAYGQARASVHSIPNVSTHPSTPAVESNLPVHDLSRRIHSIVHTSRGCRRTTYPHNLYTIYPTYPQSYPQIWGKVERSLCRPDGCVQDASNREFCTIGRVV